MWAGATLEGIATVKSMIINSSGTLIGARGTTLVCEIHRAWLANKKTESPENIQGYVEAGITIVRPVNG
jgi:hypothetical protein